jgi:anthranilate synthase component 1
MDMLSRDQFHALAQRGVLVPVYRELPADLETPVSVYLKLRGQGASFLLESVERAEQVGRYSFLGFDPRREITARGNAVTIRSDGQSETHALGHGEDPLHAVAAELRRYQPVAPANEMARGLPRFCGGAVGYMAYDLVRFFERLPQIRGDELQLPDVHLMVTDTLVAFDHVQHRLLLLANAHVPPGSNVDAAYDEAVARLQAIEGRMSTSGRMGTSGRMQADAPIQAPLPSWVTPAEGSAGRLGGELRSNVSRAQFEEAVRRAQAYIAAGDIFQVVLSQRWTRPTQADPFSIYRALRRINPSPYMFFLDLGGDPPTYLVGSSPAVLVRLQGRTAEVRPLAGTRPRGKTEGEDRAR